MSYIDFVLIWYFEKFAHSFQRLTGKDNFWLGRFAAWLNPIVINFIVFFTAKYDNLYASHVMLLFTLSLLGFYLVIAPLAAEIESYTRQKTELRNPVEVSMRGRAVRMVMLTATMLSYTLWDDFYEAAAFYTICTTSIYLFSCTPLPPSTNWFTEFISSIKPQFTSKESPSEA